jgi:hypothetical protein
MEVIAISGNRSSSLSSDAAPCLIGFNRWCALSESTYEAHMSDQDSLNDRTDDLKAMGFESGTTVFNANPRFTVEDLKKSIFGTTYSSIATIPVQLTYSDVAEVALHHVHVVFAEDGPTNAPAQKPKTYHETPDWRFEGWVEDNGSRFNGKAVRGYIVGFDDQKPTRVYAQVVPENPDPEGSIIYEDGDDTPEAVADKAI